MPPITFATLDGAAETLDVDASLSVAHLGEFLQAALGLASPVQQWVVNGRQVAVASQEQSALAGLQASGWTGEVVLVHSGAHSAATDSRAGGAVGAAIPRRSRRGPANPTSFPGMTAEDVFHYNSNPIHVAHIFRSPEHAAALRELNHHNPELASQIRSANSIEEAAVVVRDWMLTKATLGTLNALNQEATEDTMRKRLLADPNDAEAKEFFARQERRTRVLESRSLVMQEYPETFAHVLMLYVEVLINEIIKAQLLRVRF